MNEQTRQMIRHLQETLEDLKATRDIIFEDLGRVDEMITTIKNSINIAKKGDTKATLDFFRDADTNLPTFIILHELRPIHDAINTIGSATIRENWGPS